MRLCRIPGRYTHTMSERLGRTSAKEQYSYVYRYYQFYVHSINLGLGSNANTYRYLKQVLQVPGKYLFEYTFPDHCHIIRQRQAQRIFWQKQYSNFHLLALCSRCLLFWVTVKLSNLEKRAVVSFCLIVPIIRLFQQVPLWLPYWDNRSNTRECSTNAHLAY